MHSDQLRIAYIHPLTPHSFFAVTTFSRFFTKQNTGTQTRTQFSLNSDSVFFNEIGLSTLSRCISAVYSNNNLWFVLVRNNDHVDPFVTLMVFIELKVCWLKNSLIVRYHILCKCLVNLSKSLCELHLHTPTTNP